MEKKNWTRKFEIVKETDNAIIGETELPVLILQSGNLQMKVDCPECNGTGIISLKADKEIGGLCPICHGKGYKIITFKPWTGFKTKEGISKIQNTFIKLEPEKGKKCFRQMPYDEFLSGVSFKEFVGKMN